MLQKYYRPHGMLIDQKSCIFARATVAQDGGADRAFGGCGQVRLRKRLSTLKPHLHRESCGDKLAADLVMLLKSK
jgi:hypothetical protein